MQKLVKSYKNGWHLHKFELQFPFSKNRGCFGVICVTEHTNIKLPRFSKLFLHKEAFERISVYPYTLALVYPYILASTSGVSRDGPLPQSSESLLIVTCQ